MSDEQEEEYFALECIYGSDITSKDVAMYYICGFDG